MAEREGLSLGQLLLALDRTMVTLVEAPRGLDMTVGSVALVDVDDIRLGLAVGAHGVRPARTMAAPGRFASPQRLDRGDGRSGDPGRLSL